MNARAALIAIPLCLLDIRAGAQTIDPPAPRLITLRQAVDLALEHNHVVRLAALEVEQQEHKKEIARSAYFPLVRNDTNVTRVTDTQLVEVPAGGFGAVGNTLIPSSPLTLNQGGRTFVSNGTGMTQPLTQLLKIRAVNDVARAEVEAARGRARETKNSVALKVHQIYYKILVGEAQRSAIRAKIQASQDLQSERVQQVSLGSSLETELIESRAQSLQARQELLSNELQLSDLHMQFNDVVGLPLGAQVTLDPTVAPTLDSCAREECVKLALESHPKVAEARAGVEKALAAVRHARYDQLPDVEAYAGYSFHRNSPFFADHFGTLGVHVSYDLFDGGRKRATLREHQAQLAQAKENLARISDEIELLVATAYNRLERTRQMVAVSQELVTLRSESRRVMAEQLARGAALRSLAGASVAQELEAQALLLQSRLDFVQALDEMDEAVGRTPH